VRREGEAAQFSWFCAALPVSMFVMLSEEALIVLAAFGACGLLVLGVLELIWPTRPRHPVRRPPPRRPLAARASRAIAAERRPPPSGHRPHQRRAPVPGAVTAPVAAMTTVDLPVAGPAASGAAGVGGVVDECFALQQAGRHTEVIARATASLHDPALACSPASAHVTAALWSVVALAQQGLGEPTQARRALEAAVAVAPAGDRPTYQRQISVLAEGVARGLLAEAEEHPRAESPEWLETIRTAVGWLEAAVVASPADAALAELDRAARATLWRAYERSVLALLQRQEFRAARRLLREALEDPRFPVARVEAFRELFTGTFNGEIGQLTAGAIRSAQDGREADALHALRRAETLLATLSDEALGPRRREEVERRLWWVYSRLGESALQVGQPDAALEPLVHALGYDVGPERHEETRALLERALDAVPDREGAIVRCDRLWAQLRGARETLTGADPADTRAPSPLEPQQR
jgi:tetratricopeptide (TPR) repeat protein